MCMQAQDGQKFVIFIVLVVPTSLFIFKVSDVFSFWQTKSETIIIIARESHTYNAQQIAMPIAPSSKRGPESAPVFVREVIRR